MNESEITEIEKIRKDYHDFLYAVSHDFNEPLRHIKSFMTLFLEDTKDHDFTDEQHQYLKIIQDKSNKATAMLQALLSLSRLNTKPLARKTVNISDFITMIVQQFDQDIIEHDIRDSSDHEILIDTHVMLVALSAIIDNAVKFGGNEKKPCLTIETKDKAFHISIKDYGIGAKKDYLNKIVLLFQKLNHENDYKGLGVGLTLAHKIIDMHDGDLRFESEPGEYFTAHITLPLQ